MKKHLLPALLLLLALFNNVNKAQNSYSFSKLTTGNYSNLSGDVSVTAFDQQTGLYMVPGLQGKIFKFYGLDFVFGGLKTLSIGKGPFLRIDNDSSLVIIDAVFTYIDTIDATTDISYKLEGTNGNHVLKLQYKNWKLRSGPAGNFINTQIWYYQQTGVIEIHYGPRSANNASGYNTINGPNIGIFYSPDNFSGCYEKLWCKGSPNNMVLDSAANYSFLAMSGVPDDGTIYRFTPRFMPVNTTAIKREFSNNDLLLYPNPACNNLKIEGVKRNTIIDIYNVMGQVIKHNLVKTDGPLECDISEVEAGSYFLIITDETGNKQRSRLIICR